MHSFSQVLEGTRGDRALSGGGRPRAGPGAGWTEDPSASPRASGRSRRDARRSGAPGGGGASSASAAGRAGAHHPAPGAFQTRRTLVRKPHGVSSKAECTSVRRARRGVLHLRSLGMGRLIPRAGPAPPPPRLSGAFNDFLPVPLSLCVPGVFTSPSPTGAEDTGLPPPRPRRWDPLLAALCTQRLLGDPVSPLAWAQLRPISCLPKKPLWSPGSTSASAGRPGRIPPPSA